MGEALRPTHVRVVDCAPTAWVTKGKVYEVIGWKSQGGRRKPAPFVECDHGPVVYLHCRWEPAEPQRGGS